MPSHGGRRVELRRRLCDGDPPALKRYRRIGFVSTPVHGNDRLQQRRIGYRQALLDLGLAYGSHLEVEVRITPAGGAEAVQILARRDPGFEIVERESA